MPQGINYQEVADTHLSKRYNDILFDCIMHCNNAGRVMGSAPHFDNLQMYYGTIRIFFMNTFMLFSQTKGMEDENVSLMSELGVTITSIDNDIKKLKRNPAARTPDYFESVIDKCWKVHMLTMFGLQKRHMLVRMSEQEPRGKESIKYWGLKTAFQKGDVNKMIGGLA